MERLTFFDSASFTRNYLFECYQSHSYDDASSMSYQNCYRFMYQLQHGCLYLAQAQIAPFAIKPMLLFYGLSQLIKSCVLSVDPYYPENAAVLAHGITTRKRKKQGYSFLDDEVKEQRNGLYPHMIKKLFHMEHSENKYTMKVLLKQLPDMHACFAFLVNEEPFMKGKWAATDRMVFEPILLDLYHMTASRFQQYALEQMRKLVPKTQAITVVETKQQVEIRFANAQAARNAAPPFHFDKDGSPLIHRLKANHLPLPELAIYYLVLYNLSMICRYETEWWGERIHTMDCDEIPFIKQFLETVQARTKKLVECQLFQLKPGNVLAPGSFPTGKWGM